MVTRGGTEVATGDAESGIATKTFNASGKTRSSKGRGVSRATTAVSYTADRPTVGGQRKFAERDTTRTGTGGSGIWWYGRWGWRIRRTRWRKRKTHGTPASADTAENSGAVCLPDPGSGRGDGTNHSGCAEQPAGIILRELVVGGGADRINPSGSADGWTGRWISAGVSPGRRIRRGRVTPTTSSTDRRDDGKRDGGSRWSGAYGTEWSASWMDKLGNRTVGASDGGAAVATTATKSRSRTWRSATRNCS
jgi:hypothetical protein